MTIVSLFENVQKYHLLQFIYTNTAKDHFI